MKKLGLLLFIIFSLQITIAQEFEMIRHQVQLGETVRMISRKYKIEPAEIYRLNKFAVDGISQGQVLQLIVPKKEAPVAVAQSGDQQTDYETTTVVTTTTTIRKSKGGEQSEESADESQGNLGGSSAVTHTVSRGETLSGIAQQYGVTISDLKSQNEKVLKRGLQPGQVLAIIKSSGGEIQSDPVDSAIAENSDADQTDVKHTVQKGDTLFQLARKYNVSVDNIKSQNEAVLKRGLQPGQVLTITSN